MPLVTLVEKKPLIGYIISQSRFSKQRIIAEIKKIIST